MFLFVAAPSQKQWRCPVWRGAYSIGTTSTATTTSDMRDDKSFVSLGATFQPDDAGTAATGDTARNWNTVFAEAVLVPDDHDPDPPVAQVVFDQETKNPDETTALGSSPKSVPVSNPLVVIFGYAFMIWAVAAALTTELAAVLTYMIGAGFYWSADVLKNGGMWTLPLQTLCLLLTALMLAVDVLVLTIGIFIVEVVAWVACVICMLFGGISAGIDWHQHIRKVCHLTRWAFRSFHSEWKPKRMQPFSSETNVTNEPPPPQISNTTN